MKVQEELIAETSEENTASISEDIIFPMLSEDIIADDDTTSFSLRHVVNCADQQI
jgi:hypothetical protein